MIIDSSVILCLALEEAEAPAFRTAMASTAVRRMSGGTWIELSAVVTRRKLITAEHLAGVVEPLALTIEPVTVNQARIGYDAYRRFGLGTQHPARLNFGDCFSYALAIALDEPLLFKGDDFGHTDVRRALD